MLETKQENTYKTERQQMDKHKITKESKKHYRIIIEVYNTEDDYEIFRILDARKFHTTKQDFKETVDLCEVGFFRYGDHIDYWIEDQEKRGYTFEIVTDYRNL